MVTLKLNPDAYLLALRIETLNRWEPANDRPVWKGRRVYRQRTFGESAWRGYLRFLCRAN